MSAIVSKATAISPRAKALGLADKRVTGRRLAARVLSEVIAASDSSQGREAARLSLDKSIVRDWCNGAKSVHLGDVCALTPVVARRVLRTAAAALEPEGLGCVASHCRRVSASVGELNAAVDEALADGTIDDAERVRLTRLGAELLERGHALLRAMEARQG